MERENDDFLRSLYRFPCGCVGIKIGEPYDVVGERGVHCTALLFETCESGEPGLVIEGMRWDRYGDYDASVVRVPILISDLAEAQRYLAATQRLISAGRIAYESVDQIRHLVNFLDLPPKA